MNDESYSLALSDTVATAKAVELGAEIAEITFDQTISSELLKDIPAIGWIAKGFSIVTSVSDRIFFNKILRFLTKLESLGSDEKADFTAMVRIDRDFRRKVGERLILALDRVDEPEKIEMLARCFDYFLTGHLDYDEFSELAHVIDRSFLMDLRRLRSEEFQEDLYDYARMVAGGLAVGRVKGGGWDEKPEMAYSISPVGRKLQRVLRKKDVGTA